MKKPDLYAIEHTIREVAAQELMPRWRTLQAEDIYQKDGETPYATIVTKADLDTERMLTRRLADILPGSRFIGEETSGTPASWRDILRQSGYVWVIDPLDGTANFASRQPLMPNFGVIVALLHCTGNGHLGYDTVAGWIHHPVTGNMLVTEIGGGAYWDDGKDKHKLRVLQPAALEDMYGSMNKDVINRVRSFQARTLSPVPMAAASFAYPSCHEIPALLTDKPPFQTGEFSIPHRQIHFRVKCPPYEGSMPWDDAAGILAHREAGGHSMTIDGQPYDIFHAVHHGLIMAPDQETCLLLRAFYERVMLNTPMATTAPRAAPPPAPEPQ